VFDLPLTLMAEAPLAWTAATAELDGRPAVVRLIRGEKTVSLMVDVPAQTKQVVLRSTGIE
jgi:hypothetical protein